MKKTILLLFTLSLVITLYHAHTSSEDYYPNDMDDDTIVIAILDDGINPKFKNINNYIFFNSNEIPNNGLDDDANGYIDDVHGWDFVNNDNTIYDSSKFDYHGTAMADLIVRYGSQNIRLLPIKVYESNKPNMETIVQAIEYAESMNAQIVNMSWGSSNRQEYMQLEAHMQNSDLLFICASGNSSKNIDLTPDYPSSFDLDNILSVTTLNQNLSLWEWSNFGSTNVDIGVVGVDIPTFNSYSGEYELGSGTSISTAILTGYASTLLDIESFNPANLKQEINKNATQMENLKPYINNGSYLHALERGVN